MATRSLLLGRSVLNVVKNNANRQPARTIVYADSGAVLPKPAQISFPLPKVLLTVIPFLTVGAIISKNGAAILEEMEIFVPDDDDDD